LEADSRPPSEGYRAFVVAYREAAEKLRGGDRAVIFPVGGGEVCLVGGLSGPRDGRQCGESVPPSPWGRASERQIRWYHEVVAQGGP